MFSTIGVQVDEVDELSFGPSVVVVFEFEAYPEPKILGSSELKFLFERHASYVEVYKIIGTSECFVR